MIRHLLKIVWNRRRANTLIIVEICVSFIALFAITATLVFYLSNSSKPLGFDFRNVWRITLQQDE
ncbi:MAG: macrolide ABC transporter permease, partial [Patescibacteria group bacterium]|nr:macrolide ABC transporter permease [Patescibacteria group bacterium]